MIKASTLLSTLLFPVVLCAAQGPVQLQYLTEQPVLQTSSVHIRVKHDDGHSTPDVADQEMQAKLIIDNGGKQRAIIKPPVEVTFDLESLKVGTEAKGKSVSFDSKNPGSSPFMTEISKIVGKPMQVTVGEDLRVNAKSKEFVKLLQSLERLGGFRAGNLISEMFQHLFALAGEQLQVGQEYTHQLALGADQSIPVEVTYKIAAITDTEVRAVITGGFDEVEIAKVSIGNHGTSGEQKLKLAGDIKGKAVWSRKNALIYKTRVDYTYEGSLSDGTQEIPIHVKLRHKDTTKAL